MADGDDEDDDEEDEEDEVEVDDEGCAGAASGPAGALAGTGGSMPAHANASKSAKSTCEDDKPPPKQARVRVLSHEEFATAGSFGSVLGGRPCEHSQVSMAGAIRNVLKGR